VVAEPDKPAHRREDALPSTDELNRRAEALIEQIDKHLARRRPRPPDTPELTGTA